CVCGGGGCWSESCLTHKPQLRCSRAVLCLFGAALCFDLNVGYHFLAVLSHFVCFFVHFMSLCSHFMSVRYHFASLYFYLIALVEIFIFLSSNYVCL
uniref:Uncharacterized protein n=1 Tax=Neolamprologus brichardi TaxID=32507 RepID=A0A3Q4G313_NEOBR